MSSPTHTWWRVGVYLLGLGVFATGAFPQASTSLRGTI